MIIRGGGYEGSTSITRDYPELHNKVLKSNSLLFVVCFLICRLDYIIMLERILMQQQVDLKSASNFKVYL